MKNIDVVIPIFKEGEILEKVIVDLNNKVNANINFIICYDFDEEPGLNFLPNYSNISLVKNKGKTPNSAILTGIKESHSEFILVYMADDLENIVLVNEMIRLSDNYDLIIPSRYVKRGKFENAKILKKLIAILGYLLLNKILGIPYKDCTNAFKFFKRSLLNEIEFESHSAFTYAIELTVKANYLDKSILEIPCVWRDPEGRESNFKIFKWLPYYLYWAYRAFLYQLKKFFFK